MTNPYQETLLGKFSIFKCSLSEGSEREEITLHHHHQLHRLRHHHHHQSQ